MPANHNTATWTDTRLQNAVSSSQGFKESGQGHYPPAVTNGDNCCGCCVNTVDLPIGLLVDIKHGL